MWVTKFARIIIEFLSAEKNFAHLIQGAVSPMLGFHPGFHHLLRSSSSSPFASNPLLAASAISAAALAHNNPYFPVFTNAGTAETITTTSSTPAVTSNTVSKMADKPANLEENSNVVSSTIVDDDDIEVNKAKEKQSPSKISTKVIKTAISKERTN